MTDLESIKKLIDETIESDDTEKLLSEVEAMQGILTLHLLDKEVVGTRLARFVTTTTAAVIADLRDGTVPGRSQSVFILELAELLEGT